MAAALGSSTQRVKDAVEFTWLLSIAIDDIAEAVHNVSETDREMDTQHHNVTIAALVFKILFLVSQSLVGLYAFYLVYAHCLQWAATLRSVAFYGIWAGMSFATWTTAHTKNLD